MFPIRRLDSGFLPKCIILILTFCQNCKRKFYKKCLRLSSVNERNSFLIKCTVFCLNKSLYYVL